MRLPGRTTLPPDVVERLRLATGDRVLAAAPFDGGHLVATRYGLWELPAEADPTFLHWDEVDRADWHEGRFTVVLTPAEGEARSRGYPVTAPGRMPEVVRDRVTASIVVNNPHRLSGGGTVRVLARRREGEDGLRWLLAFERAADARDAARRAEAEGYLAQARESVGG